ncbi:MAG: hypothetical protein ACR2J3_02720 [Aridibacter sp.]
MSKIRKGFLSVLAFGLFLSGLAFQTNAQNNISTDLAGTYQLDTSKTENVRDVVEIAAQNNSITAIQKEDLNTKLEVPKTISIDIRGNQVTLSTSLTSPVTFTADGRTQISGSNRLRATLRGQELRISNSGGGTNYLLTLASIDGGRSLRVTKMVTPDYLSQTVFADSYYNKTGSYSTNVPNTNTNNDNNTPSNNDTYSNNDGYSSSDSNDGGYTTTDPSGDSRNDRNYPTNNRNYPTNNRNYPQTTNRNGNFYVPSGTVLSGVLENRISTKASRENDRFSLRIDSPNEFGGAVLEGYLTGVERSGKITGSSKLTFNFETIRLRNGQTYDFAGVLQNITDAQGKVVEVNNEGQIKGDSQTKETIKRGGIGAGLGAILGGIIGGGKGAIIGATIGGSAGAGSVILDGKDDVELEQGSTLSVQSTSPNR